MADSSLLLQELKYLLFFSFINASSVSSRTENISHSFNILYRSIPEILSNESVRRNNMLEES